MRITYSVLLIICFAMPLKAQNFTRVTGTILDSIPGVYGYGGAAWIDYDQDGDEDLTVATYPYVLLNNGDGTFQRSLYSFDTESTMKSLSWGDMDNDGYPDLLLVGGHSHGSRLFRSLNGAGFAQVTTTPWDSALALRGWGSSFGDMDNDGWLDIVMAAPVGFAQIDPSDRCEVLHGLGNGNFSRDLSTPITDSAGTYTVPTFYDYDLDGDADLFIGSGPITAVGAPDNLYENEFTDSGSLSFAWMNLPPLSTDSVDGQVWNFVDIDNDGDRDAFLTNYRPEFNCFIYENLGGGSWQRADTAKVGPIIEESGNFLSNCWGDYDNDGDLDVVLTSDQGKLSSYWENDGTGRFTEVDNAFPSWTNFSAVHADADNDGDLDLYMTGIPGQNAYYRNELSNGNSYVKLRLEGGGTAGYSNTTALGAVVRIWATVGGQHYMQIREVNGQNSFDGMSSPVVHFGLGDAAQVDSVQVNWPSGIVDKFVALNASSYYVLPEGGNLSVDRPGVGTSNLSIQVYPNPNTGEIWLRSPEAIQFSGGAIMDLQGRKLKHLSQLSPAGSIEVGDLPAGVYFLYLESEQGEVYLRFVKQ